MYDEHTQRVIDDTFGGDAQAYEDVKGHSLRKMIRFSDLLNSVKIHPELELATFLFIRKLLGYLPPPHLTLPYESFIRTSIYSFRNGETSFEELLAGCGEHVKQIRNNELKDHSQPYYDRFVYKKYFDHLTEVSEQARQRIIRFLGYEPALEHSVEAEVFLRKCLLSDNYTMSEKLTIPDIQAITLIKFREVLSKQGIDAAHVSPLIAADLICSQPRDWVSRII